MGTIRKILIAVLAVVFVVSLGFVIRSQMGYRQGADDYSDAQDMAGLPQVTEPVPEMLPEEEIDPVAEALRATDLAALQAVNEDVAGWIQIPDTVISYPVMHGENNDLYLDHTWDLKTNAVGAIFMDFRNSGDLSDFNTIIYGHNMRDDSMFGELHNFKNPEFLAAHPYVYVADESGCRRYEIFAAYEVSVSSAESYQLEFADDADKQAFLDKCIALSGGDTEIVPTPADQVLTLSTCTGWGHSTRWVIQAVLDEAFID